MDFVEHKCKKCDKEYYIDTDGTCATNATANCQYYGELNNCICCKENYTFVNRTCQSTSSPVSNCACMEGDFCYACKSKYHLVNNDCVLNSKGLEGCDAHYSLTQAKCVMCSEG